MKTKIFTMIIGFTILCSLLYANDFEKSRITLNLKQVDIHDILTSIAKEKKYNLVISPEVKGNVSIFLDNVTMKDAFKIITNIAGYSYYFENNIIFVDKKENIEKRFGHDGIINKTFNINFADVKTVAEQIKNVLSDKGKVIVDERTNTIVISDFKPKIKKVEKLLATIDTATQQVMIEAKIVVVTNDLSDELGIQWGGSYVRRFTSNNFFYGIKGGTNYVATGGDTNAETGSIDNDFNGAGSITQITPSGSTTTETETTISVPSEYVVNLPTVSSPAGGLGLIFGKWGFYNLSVKLTALKSKNLAKVISSPKVLALNNEKASIGQGVEVPYKSISDSGTDTEFKDAKLKLEVTPHITSNGMISLEINLTKDSIGQIAVNGEPTINTQEINTKLLLKNGETAVIGGIVENTESKGETKVPFFGDLPLLGAFFKNKINKDTKGELLIFITPQIVKSTY